MAFFTLRNVVLYSLVFLLVISGMFDLFSTFWHPNFVGLESNFLGSSAVSFVVIVCIKLGLTILLSVMLFKSSEFVKSDFIKYFYVHMSLLIIFAQLYAGYSNIMIKDQIMKVSNQELGTNYTNPSQVTSETVHLFVPSEKVSKKVYISVISMFMYIPLFFGLLSFKLWQILNNR